MEHSIQHPLPSLNQHTLIRIGRALGCDVFVARNDRNRVCQAPGFQLGYLPAGDLNAQCDAMCRFGLDDRCC